MTASNTKSSPSGASRPVFGLSVPDFIQWDHDLFFTPPPNAHRHQLSPAWLEDIARLLLIQRNCPIVLYPDVLLGQLVWGPRSKTNPWPANWRTSIGAAIQASSPPFSPKWPGLVTDPETGKKRLPPGITPDWRRGEKNCPSRCVWHGRPGVPAHRHFRIFLNSDRWGAMEKLLRSTAGEDLLTLLADDETDREFFDFHPPEWTAPEIEQRKEEIEELLAAHNLALTSGTFSDRRGWANSVTGQLYVRADLERELKTLKPGQPKKLGLFACYLPARIFGPSPKVGLTERQCYLLSALVGETTRTSGKTERPDKALVVRIEATAGPASALSRSKVNLMKNGKRRWSTDFDRKLNEALALGGLPEI
jgi:hypothetical protein